MKKVALVILLIVMPFGLTGCWDYIGVENLTIVAGIAIDLNSKDASLYDFTFEIVNTITPLEKGQVGSKIVKTTGRTVLEGIDKANQQMHMDMYFGNTELVIVGEQVARQRGLKDIIDAFLRDFGARENVIVMVAKGAQAGEMIAPPENDNYIVSYFINDSLRQGEHTPYTTRSLRLYEMYDYLKLDAQDLALPAISLMVAGQEEQTQDQGQEEGVEQDQAEGQAKESKEEPSLQINGFALFNGDKLVDFLESQYTVAFMFMCDSLKSGVYVYYVDGDPDLGVSLELNNSNATLDVAVSDQGLTLKVKVNVVAGAGEISTKIEDLGREGILRLEKAAEDSLSQQIREMIAWVQQGPGVDVFGFQDVLYRTNLVEWRQLKDQWDSLFQNAAVEVVCEFTIKDIGMSRGFER